MRKYFLLLLTLVMQFSFSQEKRLATSQIDSICKLNRPTYQSSSIIKNKKGKTIGGSSITTYNYDSRMIKGEYFEETKSKNSFSYTYFAEFYYFNSKPFYLKLKVIKTNSQNKPEELLLELDENELNRDVEIKNTLLLNLRNKIISINSQILNYIE